MSAEVYCLNCGQRPAGPLSCCRDDEEFMTGFELVKEVKRLRAALQKQGAAANEPPTAALCSDKHSHSATS